MRTHRTRLRGALALTAVLGLTVAACGDDDDAGGDTAAPDTGADETTGATTGDTTADTTADTTGGGDAEPVTIRWWHIQNNDPGLQNWQDMADEFSAMYPHVSFDINVLENDAFKPAIEANMQAGDVPDLYQSWGGGGLRDEVEAGLVQDITDEVADWVGDLGGGPVGLYQVDGRQYGVPFNAGVVGFWYNKDLFAQAGIDTLPTTWTEFLEVVQTLKDAGITPIAVGAGAQWPAHFYYAYLMIRIGGAEGMQQLAETGDFNVPFVIEAGERLNELIELEPFQPGFLGAQWDAPDGEAGTFATQGAAMSLMGQWAPGTYRTHAGVDTQDEMPFELGWFPFPAVEGGAGESTHVLGGGDGFAVGKDAPPEAIEFLRFITNETNQRTWARDSGIPVNPAAADALSSELIPVAEGLGQSTFLQLFLDQYFSPDVGAEINEQSARLFGEAASPEDAAAAITAVAGG
jgi:raffinose/stachyose/melibiose transport system substrate-binding protein